MSDYNELHKICEDFCDNIDDWCELDDGDMIDKSLVKMKAALLAVESTEKSDNNERFEISAIFSDLSWFESDVSDKKRFSKLIERGRKLSTVS